MRVRAGGWLGAGLVLAALGGCAAEPKMAPASPASGGDSLGNEALEGEPASIEEAQARLERARAMLGGVLSGPSAPWTGAGTTSSATPTLPPVTRSTESAQEAGKAGEDDQARRTRCATPCNAIASMRRAVEAICRMAGAGDARCTDARKTLGDSEAKVAPCGC
jgi:hypothetical protein